MLRTQVWLRSSMKYSLLNMVLYMNTSLASSMLQNFRVGAPAWHSVTEVNQVNDSILLRKLHISVFIIYKCMKHVCYEHKFGFVHQ